jgi:anti-anti-sigma factor
MINNALIQTESSVCASIPRHAIPHNRFLAVGNDFSIREPGIPISEQVLKVVGFEEMTAANCNRFRTAACAAWKGHADVEIDLSETTFIDCAGIGALIAVRNLTLEHNGVARLMHPTASVQQMLDLTRTGQLFDIVNTPHADLDFGPAAHN